MVLSPSSSCVTRIEVSRKMIRMCGVNSYPFRWEPMVEHKREQVPQISVEAVENEACSEET